MLSPPSLSSLHYTSHLFLALLLPLHLYSFNNTWWFHEQINSPRQPHNFYLPLPLSFCTSWQRFFLCLYSSCLQIYLQQCQFYGVITSLVYFSFSPFLFLKVHCVRFSFPPPLLLCLSSVITALDSSSDGKCFSIPRSPSLPLILHLSLSFTKQITSWLL